LSPGSGRLDEPVAEAAIGHQDSGELVRKLYGHPDATLARERVREAFRRHHPLPVPLLATGS
jgi:hypothetical protein